MNILPLAPWKGPPLPQGVDLTWERLAATARDYSAGIKASLGASLTARVLPDVIALTYTSISRAALDAIKPGVLQPWINSIEANGQYNKFEVFYLNVSPPPVFWDYKCLKCLWWQPTESCKVVEGKISPQGWCALWVPPKTYKPFTWPSEFIQGNW